MHWPHGVVNTLTIHKSSTSFHSSSTINNKIPSFVLNPSTFHMSHNQQVHNQSFAPLPINTQIPLTTVTQQQMSLLSCVRIATITTVQTMKSLSQQSLHTISLTSCSCSITTIPCPLIHNTDAHKSINIQQHLKHFANHIAFIKNNCSIASLHNFHVVVVLVFKNITTKYQHRFVKNWNV